MCPSIAPALKPGKPDYYNGSLKEIFSREIPLIDVRAPVEFEKGAFPQSLNIPILDNHQREMVGTCYKQEGQKDAVNLGFKLVSGKDRENKIERWVGFINKNPQSILYCYRGGLRSAIAFDWIRDRGVNITLIEGGYKRLRNYLLNNLEEQCGRNPFLVISGNTGSGKTSILKDLSSKGFRAIDLEGLANHRGSAFGRMITPQPTQVNYENMVSIQFLIEEKKTSMPFIIEDESAMIGQVRVPGAVYEKKRVSPIFLIDIPFEERVENILTDYVEETWPFFKDHENPYTSFFNFYKDAFERIKKRLGSASHDECIKDLNIGVEEQRKKDSFSHHKNWIKKLLINYYDPLYEKGLARKSELIIGKGDKNDFISALKSLPALPS